MDRQQLEALRDANFADIDRPSLVDISTVTVDTALPIAERWRSYMEQIKNPYCFLAGGTPVHIRYIPSKKTLAQSLGDYFISLK